MIAHILPTGCPVRMVGADVRDARIRAVALNHLVARWRSAMSTGALEETVRKTQTGTGVSGPTVWSLAVYAR